MKQSDECVYVDRESTAEEHFQNWLNRLKLSINVWLEIYIMISIRVYIKIYFISLS